MLTYNDVIKQCTMLDSIDIGYLREAKYIRTFLGKLILLINRDPSMKIIVKKYCISNPYEVNRSDIQGRTPVFYALTISNIDICAEMIDFLCKSASYFEMCMDIDTLNTKN